LETHVTVTAASYTAKAGDRFIGVNRAGTVGITLPTSQLRAGRLYTVKDESGAAATNNITVATEGAETIDGSATDTINQDYGAKAYYSDGSNWFTVPLLAVSSHTLASHSARAHSDLTGVVTGDHHTEAHQAAHASGGADAIKLDDLAAPDDNTDLDVSTTAHGLVPKGTNTGNFLKDDGSWAAAGGGPAQSTQAALKAETNEDTYPPPDLIKHSPGMAKCWAEWEQTGTHALRAHYNITSVIDGGTAGETDILYNVDMIGSDHAVLTVSDQYCPTVATNAATGCTINMYSHDGTATDSNNCYMAAFGDQ
jgi:hypothetical protein